MKISNRVVVGCAFALMAVGEVLLSLLAEAVSGEESLEATLARGTPSQRSLGSIPEGDDEDGQCAEAVKAAPVAV